MKISSDHHHRLHAIQIASALPNDPEDALIVLRLATQLVTDFLAVDEPAKRPAPVIALIGGGERA
ncbi:hypothetical protein [Bradyrhizobium sp. AZCC 2289]|jgi:hypothetical protein|uniref:hypothetical protein n=1 Tax=Bradyrhizobium sp. AZCC 2289 TaxID=3117026 RepID=UPI002FEFF5A4